ncbi:dynein heavy chain 17, axonemal-like [Mesocricetus auratus]|uniref:Dynein heavy chain 17, axonemal-like n=1 Tax=Mesocricetus auratus TaxID=10036 RepID=A0ABM2XMQ1_MESAU|nr:dynein heavy chain 17, axonemal-like [Mesocricetus auratus]
MRALRDFNIPKIVTDDLPVFMGLIGDLFPALDVPRKRDLNFEKIIKQSIVELKLQAEDSFVLKVVQLEELLQVRHSVFVIGNAGSGKSQARPQHLSVPPHHLPGTARHLQYPPIPSQARPQHLPVPAHHLPGTSPAPASTPPSPPRHVPSTCQYPPITSQARHGTCQHPPSPPRHGTSTCQYPPITSQARHRTCQYPPPHHLPGTAPAPASTPPSPPRHGTSICQYPPPPSPPRHGTSTCQYPPITSQARHQHLPVLKSLNKTYQNLKRKPVAVDLDPKAVTCDELFGIINPATREWKDGLFSTIMRDLANITHDGPKWIVLDGDIDPMWIESLNTVMDDNKVLTLASNERIPLNRTMRLVFEISHLRTATPATVSRAGILYINPADLGWNP